jgi:hypothetical protein
LRVRGEVAFFAVAVHGCGRRPARVRVLLFERREQRRAPTRACVCLTGGLGRALTCRKPDQRPVRDQSLSQIPLLSRPYDRDLAVGICTIAAVYNTFAAEPLELACITHCAIF